MDFGIKFDADELPASTGDICDACKQPITSKTFYPFLQFGTGKPESADYTGNKFCEKCYASQFGEDSAPAN